MLRVMLVLPLSAAPLLSVTVTAQVMVSPLEATAELRVMLLPLPMVVPPLVQLMLVLRLSLSASLALTEQVSVLLLLAEAGLMAMVLTTGAVFKTVRLLEVELAVALPSLAVTVQVMLSPLSKWLLPDRVLLDPLWTKLPSTYQS